MPRHEDVEFKTLDGLTLRGWLYPADVRGPAVILTPGVSTSLFQASPMRRRPVAKQYGAVCMCQRNVRP